jgi:hypothetical protein
MLGIGFTPPLVTSRRHTPPIHALIHYSGFFLKINPFFQNFLCFFPGRYFPGVRHFVPTVLPGKILFSSFRIFRFMSTFFTTKVEQWPVEKPVDNVENS